MGYESVYAVLALGESRRREFLAPVGMSAGFTAMETWLLWERSDAEVIDPLVFMGAAAGLLGLVMGALAAIAIGMIGRHKAA